MGKRDRTGSDKKARKRAKREESDREVKATSEDVKGDEGKDKSNSDNPAKSSTDKKSTKSTTVKSKKIGSSETGSKKIFLKKKVELAVSLLPGSLRNCEESVEDSIRQLLLKYSEGLGGILMAYDNVRLKADGKGEGRGWILNELPFIHYNATCDALVFSPTVGSEVRFFEF
jgi:hypothetical protein